MMYQKICLFLLLNCSFGMQGFCFHRNIEQQVISQNVSPQSLSILSQHLKEPHFYLIKRDRDCMHKLIIHELTPEEYPIACAQLLTKTPTYSPFVYITVATDAVPLITHARVVHLSYQAMQKSYREEQSEI